MHINSTSSAARSGGRRAFLGGVVILAFLTSLAPTGRAQPAEPPNGPRRTDPGWHALVHATLVPEAGRTLEDATIIFKSGVIQSVSAGAEAPVGARIWDCTGLTVYPGLVEPFLPVETPAPDAASSGTHWNKQVMAQRSAQSGKLDAETKKKLRAMGYVAAATTPKGGIFRGTGAVVSLADEGASSDPLASVLAPAVFHTVGLELARGADRDYPASKMGAIALVRQTFADAPWYARAMESYNADGAKNARPAPDDAAAALNQKLPVWFDVNDELDVLRVAKIAKEFDLQAVIVASGAEFRRLDAVVQTGLPIVLPLAYPERPEVGTQAERESVDLRQLMTWEAAPTNATRLADAGASVSLTSSKLPKDQKFTANLREAIKAGLSEDKALAMMTTAPAEVLGLSKRLGKVAPGMNASFVVVKGSLFDEDRKVRDVWIDGVRHEVTPTPRAEIEGEWKSEFGAPSGPIAGTLKITEKNEVAFTRPVTEADLAREAAAKAKPEKPEDGEKAAEEKAQEGKEADAAPKKDGTRSFKARAVKLDENRLNFVLDGAAVGVEGSVPVSALIEGTMLGTAIFPDGSAVAWTGARDTDAKKKSNDKKDEDKDRFTGIPEKFGLPFGPFASDAYPEQKELWIEHATIWTSGPQGNIEDGVLHIAGGKVKGVYGSGAAPKVNPGSGVLRIDAKGRHISPGMIDCHSHTGVSGNVNEGTQSCTAEVRIFDVIDPDAIGWYRELAGGLTAVNQLHGSANAIGGQNSVVKIRWGAATPDDMRFEGATPGIKFALGENVKQSNWDNAPRTRYPQTRMGVETYIRDRFIAAKEYDASLKKSAGARRDFELEALAEILRGERLVHCHSYRQDEILMLCRVAKDFGFKIGTFQHVLEGYKVAEAIRENAIGGSCFSDWWAYKVEVFDAIPYDGAIMHDAGVTVSFNSDSDELARRMNVEAAKAVKYGGLAPEEALKFLTLNPAKQLQIDHRVGSLEAGKDADFVIWSGSPLSSMSRCEATYVDGREMFSLARDAEMRTLASAERGRIIQKLLSKPKRDSEGDESSGGRERRGKPGSADEAPPTMTSGRGAGLAAVGMDIESDRDYAFRRSLETQFNWLITNGLDPYASHAGDCGCADNCFFQNN